MKKKRRLYMSLARLMPRRYREHVARMLEYTGSKKLTADDWIGSANLLALLGIIAFLIASPLLLGSFNPLFVFYGVLFAAFAHIFTYVMIHISIEDRTNRIEHALPDLLQLTASNIRSGMTPFKALKFATKKDFGPLKKEIDYVTNRAMGTVNFSSILLDMNKRVKSSILERSLRLFSNSLKTGGHSARLLEEIARDIIETRALKKELLTSTRTYSMFILFTVTIGTPLLLAIAISFLETMLTLQPATPDIAMAGLGGLIGDINITPAFMTKISVVMLLITSLLAGILIGVIKEGNYVHGFRYGPIIAISSMTMFMIMNFLVGSFFGI